MLDLLIVGGVLYAGILKSYGVNVDCVEIDPRAIISQLFTIYCIRNNGTERINNEFKF